MDTTQHYPGLVYHPHPPQPHSISDSAPPSSYPQDMSWQVSHQSPPNSSASAHAQMSHMMPPSQEHIEYATHPVTQSFLSRHDPFSHHQPPSPSVDAGPQSNQMSFESPQIPGSIGPDRGMPRRRLRAPGRLQSNGEQPDFSAVADAHDHIQNSHHSSHQGSRPHTPSGSGAPEQYMQLQEQPPLRVNASPVLYGRAGYPPYYGGYPSLLPQSRSTSGSTTSATSAGSNQRSASPATSVASGHTSFSSASMPAPDMHSASGFTPLEPQRKEPNKKRRLYNTDRRAICVFAREHPGVKQEDIASQFRVERSTVSKILKQKARWLSVAVDEEVQVAKMRPSKFPELEYRLAEWVKAVSKNGTVLSDALLRQRAREIGDSQGYTTDKFKASSGWLENFKHRHGIRRGVWQGSGTADVKARACAQDFHPDVPEPPHPPGPFHIPDSPRSPQLSEFSVGVDDGGQRPQSMQAMHPSSSLNMQSTWTQPGEQTSNGDSSSSGLMYSADQQHYSLSQDSSPDAERSVEAVLPAAEPVAIQLGPEEGGNGEEVYVMPMMPEVLDEDEEVPDLAEAEKALDKVLVYVRANFADLDLPESDAKLLTDIKYRLFAKATGQPYDPRFMPKHT